MVPRLGPRIRGANGMPDQNSTAVELRKKLARYRELAREINDERAATGILALTDELERQVRDLEQRSE